MIYAVIVFAVALIIADVFIFGPAEERRIRYARMTGNFRGT